MRKVLSKILVFISVVILLISSILFISTNSRDLSVWMIMTGAYLLGLCIVIKE